MSVIEFKLTVRDSDKKWTEVAKLAINAIMDYASKTTKFRTVRIGEWAEVDTIPGFYITFPGLDSQGRVAFVRTGHIFDLKCTYAVKGSDYKEALQELLECHGAFLAKLDEDHDMAGVPNGVPEVGVPAVRDVDVIGFATGSDAGRTAQSHEYLYGATTVKVKAIMNLRG